MGMRSPIFQWKRSASLGARDGALAVLQKSIPLIVGNDQFRKDLALIFRVDHELGEEVFFFNIGPAKPVVVGDDLDAGNAEDLVAIGKRDEVDDRGAVDDDEAIRPGHIGAAVEGVAHDGKKGEQEQRDGERADGEEQANFLAKQIRPDDARKFHATPPAVTLCGDLRPLHENTLVEMQSGVGAGGDHGIVGDHQHGLVVRTRRVPRARP